MFGLVPSVAAHMCVHCQQGPLRIKATHQRTLKHTRQGNQLMVLHLQCAQVPLCALQPVFPPSFCRHTRALSRH